MNSLVENGPMRAASFFALALGIAVVLGVLMGDLRLGIRWGLGLGAAFAVFAYLFVRPTDSGGADEEARDTADERHADGEQNADDDI